ncbi:AMIN-like domain-containing (lipo)protein [Nonomuraea guangzhouensis]|uniref:AMIN-like domain-containing protein n=1 Tax=Nonomuraea guangzhouensis TaxID=1291555 RepID=A0ABW4GIW4_9ACTN
MDVDHGGGDPAIVLGVRYAAHDTYDRVVIDLKGAMPGYNAQWVAKLLQDGSGKNFHVPGGAYLQILLNPAEAHDAKGAPTWKGGPVFPAKLGNITHVVKTGDFEGYVGVGLVLDHQAAFDLKEQTGPDRLVIDVAH